MRACYKLDARLNLGCMGFSNSATLRHIRFNGRSDAYTHRSENRQWLLFATIGSCTCDAKAIFLAPRTSGNRRTGATAIFHAIKELDISLRLC